MERVNPAIYLNAYQEHLHILSKVLGCKLIQQPKMPGMMYVEFGYVEGPTITNQSDYLVNLHELGHFAWGHTQGRPPKQSEKFYFQNGVLKSEAQAWQWALNQCLDEVTDASRKFMWDTCLGSYYGNAQQLNGTPTTLGNGNRHWVQFVYDEPDKFFTSIVQRIWGNCSPKFFAKTYHHWNRI